MVAATNERLIQLVEQGRFRADLRHRLSGLVITVPSLAERVDDIPALVRYFVRGVAGKDLPIDEAVMTLLMDSAWPGNVRELRQVIETAVAFTTRSLDRASIEAALAYRTLEEVDVPPRQQVADRRNLLRVLEGTAWDVDSAALQLGVHRATFYRRMKRHGIPAPRFALGRSAATNHSAELG
jgi:transcriptional regulator of acetoin/glycerol metabolism